jgi:predicted flap endonuclease-1-like 5' DNA nuclease
MLGSPFETTMKNEPNEGTELEPEAIEFVEPPPAPKPISSSGPPAPPAARVGGLTSGIPPAPPRPTGLGLGHPAAPPRPTPSVPPVAMRPSVPPLPRPSAVPATPLPLPRPSAAPAIPPPALRPSAPAMPPPPAAKTDVSAAKFAALEGQIEDGRRALATKEAEIRTVVAQRDTRIAEVEQLRREQTEMRRERDDLRTECDRLREDLARTAEQAGELAVLRRALADREAAAVAQPAPGPTGDDLRRIRGIGPAFERSLRQNGVSTIAQIAAWTDADIAAIAPKLKIKPERVRREGCVEAAMQIKGTSESSGEEPA